MPERGAFLRELMEARVPLASMATVAEGARMAQLHAVWQGPAIYEDDYLKAIQLAKISLGLLSKGNRDLHTPEPLKFLFGGLLCAERHR